MPATPAWPPDSGPRLYVDAPLGEGMTVPIDGSSAHYLISVMRVREGDAVLLFNGRDGEWSARAAKVRKRDLVLECVAQMRLLEPVPDFWLCVAPLKKARIDLVAEKACELGVARLKPVMTRRSIVDRLNLDRLKSHLVEAAEQCGRTVLPALDPMVGLEALLKSWPQDRTLFFADENGGERAAAAMERTKGPAAVLIGPEGGFDPAEAAAIRALPQAVAISLGPRILRAETAAIASTALWMAVKGDW